MRRARLLFLSAAVALAALLGLAEVAARLVISVPRLPPVLEKPPYYRVILDSVPRGIAVPVRVSANRWGMRGEEPPLDWRGWDTWIVIGSSTTLCSHLDDSRAWPQALQVRLRGRRAKTWVGNAGQDGVTSGAAVLLADQVLRKLRPDGILVLAGASDMVLSLYDDRRRKGSLHDQALQRRLARAHWKDSGLETSILLREWKAWLQRLEAAAPLRVQGTHRSWFPPSLAAPEDPLPPLDTLLPSLPLFRANIKAVHGLAKELGMRAVFLTHPGLYGPDSAWARLEARRILVEGREYRISAATEHGLLARFNLELLSLCASERMECFDLASRVPHDTLYYYDEGHFNDAGARLVAEEIGGYLLSAPPGSTTDPD